MNDHMYESVIVVENLLYGEGKTHQTNCPSKNVIFHNSSKEHVTVIATDTKTGNAVEVMIKKDEIPDWILKQK